MSEATGENTNVDQKKFRSPLLSFFVFGLGTGLVYGLILGLINLFGSAAMPLGLGRLGLETVARDIGYGLRWGLIWGLLLLFYGWLLRLITGQTRRVIVAQLVGLVFWLIGVGFVIAALLRTLDQRLPLPYQEYITPQIFLSRFVFPLLAYNVTIKPVVVLVLLGLSLLVPFLIGALIVRLMSARVDRLPLRKAPSLAMTKKSLIVSAIVTAVFVVLIFSPRALGKPKNVPNVLVVSIDTLRADGLHCYGNPNETSPIIDKLATTGVRYENMFSSAPWTLPGHVTMLTGLEPDVHGVYMLNRTIPREAAILSEVFKNEGYHTFAMTSNFLVGPSFGFGRGFDYFIMRPEADATVVSKLSLALLKRAKEPWFGFVHFFDPHLPYNPSAKSKQELGIGGPEVDNVLSTMTHLLYRFIDLYLPYDQEHKDAVWKLYEGEVRDADRELGTILKHVDLSNTLVVITSDHGEEFNEHGWSGHSVALFDESLRVPLIVHGPKIPRGVVIKKTADLAQLVPLILNHLGLEDPLDRGGPDLGMGAYAHTNAFGNHRYSWRKDGWSFLTRNEFTYGERTVEHPPGLYNDPTEQENLIAQDPERAAQMQDDMDHFIGREIRRHGRMEAGSLELDESRLNRLRELGYVQ